MGLRFPDQMNCHCFFVTTTFHHWKTLGNVKGLYPAMAESLNFCAHKFDAQIAAYVLMPSHIHLLMLINGKHLAAFMRDFKKYVAQKVIPVLNIKLDKVWKDGFDRVGIETEDIFRIKLDYIHQNPVKAGLVSRPENWEWSSAVDYYTDMCGPIPVYKDWS